MFRLTKLFVSLALAVVTCSATSSPLSAADLTASIGQQTTVLRDGQYGLHGFPDQPVAVLSRRPLRYFLVAGDSTCLMEGTSFETSKPAKLVLAPSKSPESYDGQYAGINSIYFDKDRKEWLAFFQAEKPTGGRNEEGIPRFYATVGLAVSTDGGLTFKKIGPVITGRPEDPNWKGTAQGCAEPSVCPDPTGEWLYLFYTEHSRRDPATGKERSVITCMTRSRASDGGRPGAWKKFYRGSFDEPGLGGKDTEVANCWAASVTYLPEMKKYVMTGSRGCVGFYTSEDGIEWGNPTVLFEMADIPFQSKEYAVHPSLHVERATANEARGLLLYGYRPELSPQQPSYGHYLVKRPITLKLSGGADTPGVEKQLAGTKWRNSNGVTFEWTKDGRFLHNGKEREWKALGGRKVQVTFGPQHKDTLEFDQTLTEFKQLIRGGPESFVGKRADR